MLHSPAYTCRVHLNPVLEVVVDQVVVDYKILAVIVFCGTDNSGHHMLRVQTTNSELLLECSDESQTVGEQNRFLSHVRGSVPPFYCLA